MEKQGRKRNKAYYMQQSKRNCLRLDAGMKGFLLTCNNNEKRAVQESYNILNEYADNILGPQSTAEEMKSDVDDFEAEIRKEVEMSKTKNKTTKRFQVVDTKTTNCVFIKTTVDNPNELISAFLGDVYTKKESKCRHILRIHPVLGTCRAVVDKIEKLAEEVLKPFFQPASDSVGILSYCIVYKVRCNSLGREEILHAIGKVVSGLNSAVKVNFDDPDYVVSVDVLQKFCCISVMRNYFKYRKYNVQELCKTPTTAAVATAAAGANSAATTAVATAAAETNPAATAVEATAAAETNSAATAVVATATAAITSVATASASTAEVVTVETSVKTDEASDESSKAELVDMAINSDADVISSDKGITEVNGQGPVEQTVDSPIQVVPVTSSECDNKESETSASAMDTTDGYY